MFTITFYPGYTRIINTMETKVTIKNQNLILRESLKLKHITLHEVTQQNVTLKKSRTFW